MRNLADSLSSRRIFRTFARVLCALLISSGAIASSAFADGNVTTFNYTGAIQTFTVPYDGYYLISATGASGAAGFYTSGGAGARQSGVVHLRAGTILNIAVGGAGGRGEQTGGG